MGKTRAQELTELQERLMVLSGQMGKYVNTTIVRGILLYFRDDEAQVTVPNHGHAGLWFPINQVKPDLRTYEQMTKEEWKTLAQLNYEYEISDASLAYFKDDIITGQKQIKAEWVPFLLSIGVDVYGWLEKGWALPMKEEGK